MFVLRKICYKALRRGAGDRESPVTRTNEACVLRAAQPVGLLDLDGREL